MGIATKNLTTKDTRAGYGRAPCAAAALESAIIRGEGDARGNRNENPTTKDTKDHEGKNPSHGIYADEHGSEPMKWESRRRT